MIGKIYYSLMPYYNVNTQRNSFKERPVLIIGMADSGDYNVLPVSKVSHSNMIDPEYDIQIIPEQYPKLNLKYVSYVRVHKQTVANRASLKLGEAVGDIKGDYSELYLFILTKLEEYNKKIIDSAL